MSAPVRWGILGTGRIAARFAFDLRATPGSRLTAVGSRTVARAGAFVGALGPAGAGALACGSYEELVARDDVDVVYVATPHSRHRQDAFLCFAHGKPVLCEKPLAPYAADARAIVEAARAAGLFCMEALLTRCLPAFVELRRQLGTGAIGEPARFRAELGFAVPFDAASRYFDPELAGGALLDLGVYVVSAAIGLLGPPDDVTGLAVVGETGVDVEAGITLRHGRAISGLACGILAQGANDAVVVGSGGWIRVHAPLVSPSLLTIQTVPAAGSNAGPPSDRLPRPERIDRLGRGRSLRDVARLIARRRVRALLRPYLASGLVHEIVEVERCLRAGERESPLVPLADSIATAAVLDAVRGASQRAQGIGSIGANVDRTS